MTAVRDDVQGRGRVRVPRTRVRSPRGQERLTRGSFRHVRRSERRRSHFSPTFPACLRVRGGSWRAGWVNILLGATDRRGKHPRARCRSLGFRPRLWAHTSEVSSKLAGIGDLAFRTRPERRYLYQLPAAASHLGVEVEHGLLKAYNGLLGAFVTVFGLYHVFYPSCHEPYGEFDPAPPPPRQSPEPATFRAIGTSTEHLQPEHVHHDDGHHDDTRGDLPDGEPGLGQ